MRRKQRIKPFKKILYIEDGSVNLNYIEHLNITNPDILIIIYRQGSAQPVLININSSRSNRKYTQ